MARIKRLHGVSAYVNRGCRCDRCKQSWADYIRNRRHQKEREKYIEQNATETTVTLPAEDIPA